MNCYDTIQCEEENGLDMDSFAAACMPVQDVDEEIAEMLAYGEYTKWLQSNGMIATEIADKHEELVYGTV